MRTVHHLQNLVIVKVLVQLLADSLQLFEVQHAVFVLVKQSEDSL